ncbi:hypothetical protein EAI_01229 [Harpegnathos saltator]|uniref:Uncharacterized protein n=1 Tax=Harpegnathos saltator TaxID=610380 RepID=E2BGL7_HARSA|nr:hypothetical protein EAI_01229 [Harpegnathos saltator]
MKNQEARSAGVCDHSIAVVTGTQFRRTPTDVTPEDPVRAEQSRLEDPQQNAADSICCVSVS